MAIDLVSPDYALRWPPELLSSELEAAAQASDASARVEFVLNEAFAGSDPADRWRNAASVGHPGLDHEGFDLVRTIMNAAARGELRLATELSPRWRQRHGDSTGPPPLDPRALRREFARIVDQLHAAGYFDRAAPRRCVDENFSGPTMTELIENELGVTDLWPLGQVIEHLADDRFYELIEFFHDHAARPRSRWYHSYYQCGWHYGDFALDAGQRLFRWQVNQLLARSSIDLRLADDGEDRGRLVQAVDDARSDLVARARAITDPTRRDSVDHAIAQFRARDATIPRKRSAVVALAALLEERRPLLKASLIRRDEADLFDVANNFHLRHRNERQRGDYDPVFLDWMFWWYLATVELTDRLLERQATS